MTLARHGIGTLTQRDVATINSKLDALYDALSIKYSALQAAERDGGFSRREIEAAYLTHTQLQDEVTTLAGVFGDPEFEQASDEEHAAFIAQLRDLDARVARFDPGEQFLGARRRRNIILASLGALTVAGGFAWFLWRSRKRSRSVGRLRGLKSYPGGDPRLADALHQVQRAAHARFYGSDNFADVKVQSAIAEARRLGASDGEINRAIHAGSQPAAPVKRSRKRSR